MTPAEIAHRYRLLRDGRLPDVQDAAMYLDFTEYAWNSVCPIIRCKRNPAVYAAPIAPQRIVAGDVPMRFR
jgi:hypothetical protein